MAEPDVVKECRTREEALEATRRLGQHNDSIMQSGRGWKRSQQEAAAAEHKQQAVDAVTDTGVCSKRPKAQQGCGSRLGDAVSPSSLMQCAAGSSDSRQFKPDAARCKLPNGDSDDDEKEKDGQLLQKMNKPGVATKVFQHPLMQCCAPVKGFNAASPVGIIPAGSSTQTYAAATKQEGIDADIDVNKLLQQLGATKTWQQPLLQEKLQHSSSLQQKTDVVLGRGNKSMVLMDRAEPEKKRHGCGGRQAAPAAAATQHSQPAAPPAGCGMSPLPPPTAAQSTAPIEAAAAETAAAAAGSKASSADVPSVDEVAVTPAPADQQRGSANKLHEPVAGTGQAHTLQAQAEPVQSSSATALSNKAAAQGCVAAGKSDIHDSKPVLGTCASTAVAAGQQGPVHAEATRAPACAASMLQQYSGCTVHLTEVFAEFLNNAAYITLDSPVGHGLSASVYAAKYVAPAGIEHQLAVKVFKYGLCEGADAEMQELGRLNAQHDTDVELQLLHMLRGQEHAVQLLAVGELHCPVQDSGEAEVAATADAGQHSSCSSGSKRDIPGFRQLRCAVLERLTPFDELETRSHSVVKKVIKEVLVPLQKMHSGQLAGGKAAIHRDVKRSNLLYSKQRAKVYLADFGSAAIIEAGRPAVADTVCGTPFSMAPELAKIFFEHQEKSAGAPAVQQIGVESYSTSVDMWAVGTLVIELYAGPRKMRELLQVPEGQQAHEHYVSLVEAFVEGKLTSIALADDSDLNSFNFRVARDFVRCCCGIDVVRCTASAAAAHAFVCPGSLAS